MPNEKIKGGNIVSSLYRLMLRRSIYVTELTLPIVAR